MNPLHSPEYDNYTDEELVRAWNHLETCKGTDEVFNSMDTIADEATYRGIIAWDKEGKITERREV